MKDESQGAILGTIFGALFVCGMIGLVEGFKILAFFSILGLTIHGTFSTPRYVQRTGNI